MTLAAARLSQSLDASSSAPTRRAPADAGPRLSVIVVSYNTRELTLRCLETLFAQTTAVQFEVLVVDNASSDGSADAIAERCPQATLIRSAENLGFARANNLAAQQATGHWLLLLNPDTEVLDRAVERLVAFGDAHPEAGIYGGRTVFPDGSLNIASCWNRITPWSLFCNAIGLSAAFKGSALFDTEAMGPFKRDAVRHVDIVVGCFFLISRDLWERLGGFDLTYWMYGEEADLCLRARKLGYRPLITPEATIVHLVGASSNSTARKSIMVARARTTIVRRHWPASQRAIAIPLIWLWGANRYLASAVLSRISSARFARSFETWRSVWSARGDWLRGYQSTQV